MSELGVPSWAKCPKCKQRVYVQLSEILAGPEQVIKNCKACNRPSEPREQKAA